MGKLTEARIRSLKPANRDRMIGDGNALYLRVRTSGTKTWILRKKHAGQVRIVTLGDYPEKSLAEVRARAATEAVVTRARRRGEAPPVAHEHRALTVAKLAREFHDKRVAGKYRRTANARVYRDRLIADLGHVKLKAVSHRSLVEIIKPYAADAPVAANRFLAYVKAVFRFAVASGYIEHSPAAALDRSIAGGKETSRERKLSDDEIRKLWRAEGPHGALLRFLFCTLARIGEAQKATWGAIKGARWTIPPEHAKNGKATWVSLAAPALAEIGKRGADADLVFASVSPTAVQAWVRRFCEREGIEPAFTPHDLRRTGATRMGDLGVPPHVVARCLNHTINVSDSIGVYFRAELEPERVDAFKKWGAEIERIVNEHQPGTPPDSAS